MVSPEEWLRKPGTVGRVLPNAQMRIIKDGKVLPAGEIGEVYTRQNAADFTYLNLPDKRADIEIDGFITAGDVGYFDEDGYLFLCDRKANMVISGGVNIYPAEIEGALQMLPGVRDCAVFGIPDAEFGEALMAVVEPLPGAQLDVKQMQQDLIGKLAKFKVPKRIEIRANLPREDSGKIFTRRLRDPYWEGLGRKI
jgi:long-chain acyl-CoA synthetase